MRPSVSTSPYISTRKFGRQFCRLLTKERLYLSADEMTPFLPYHTQLIEILSTSALFYIFRTSPQDMFLAGLWLSYRAIHCRQYEQTSKALPLILSAIAKEPLLKSHDVEKVVVLLAEVFALQILESA